MIEWLIIGAILGAAGLRLVSWTRAKNLAVGWFVWVLGVLAVLLAVLTLMDYRTLQTEMEPGSAGVILWLLGGPALILAVLAVVLVWRQNQNVFRTPTED